MSCRLWCFAIHVYLVFFFYCWFCVFWHSIILEDREPKFCTNCSLTRSIGSSCCWLFSNDRIDVIGTHFCINYCICCNIFDPYEYLVDLCIELCLSGRLAGQQAGWPSCVAKTLALDITHKLFNLFFPYLPYLYAPLTFTILDQFHWPWHYLGVTRSVQSKTYWCHFHTHFELITMKFDMMLKQLKLNIPTLFLSGS